MARGAEGVTEGGLTLARRARRLTGSVIDASIGLLQKLEGDVVSFAMGCPSPDAIPATDLRRIAERLLADPAADALNYGPTEGEATLRAALLDLLAGLGVPAGPRCLLVTAGGMQGLDLACKVFVDPGDLVVVESPTYTNGTATIASYEGDVLEVPVDDEGLMVELVPELV
ncbi:MAG TPA: aminotransferase class I/II-fold pyridoxal phosphate-dependent enzyme, partial [Solirubrobacterales bacterium]|nr:aminotransferase class I/II-fold pyridoxal phosphate-dependent enzyme [Solirubrobacterales bacterium]